MWNKLNRVAVIMAACLEAAAPHMSMDGLIEVLKSDKVIELDVGLKQFTENNSILPGIHRKQTSEMYQVDVDIADELGDAGLFLSTNHTESDKIIEKRISDFKDVQIYSKVLIGSDN